MNCGDPKLVGDTGRSDLPGSRCEAVSSQQTCYPPRGQRAAAIASDGDLAFICVGNSADCVLFVRHSVPCPLEVRCSDSRSCRPLIDAYVHWMQTRPSGND